MLGQQEQSSQEPRNELLEESLKLTEETARYNSDIAGSYEYQNKLLKERLAQQNKEKLEQQTADSALDGLQTRLRLQEAQQSVVDSYTQSLRSEYNEIQRLLDLGEKINFIDSIVAGSERDLRLNIEASAIQRQGGVTTGDYRQELLDKQDDIVKELRKFNRNVEKA